MDCRAAARLAMAVPNQIVIASEATRSIPSRSKHRDPACRKGMQGRGLEQALDRRGSVISSMPGDMRFGLGN
jgi:hypothetical protein